ncbi:MAG: TRAP transporter small permease [Gemmatimonadales bacterium]
MSSLRQKFAKFLEYVVILLITALAVIVVVGVAFRKAGAALVWYDEVASILLAWLTYYGSCLAALNRAHIGFPRLVQSLPPGLKRYAIIMREVAVIGFFAVAGWAGWQVLQVLHGSYLVSLPGFPRQIAQSVIPIGSVLFIVAELLSLERPAEGETT